LLATSYAGTEHSALFASRDGITLIEPDDWRLAQQVQVRNLPDLFEQP